MSIADVPFIITWGAMSIADGVQVLCIGLLGLCIALAQLKSFYQPFAALSLFSYIVQMALFATTPVRTPATRACCLAAFSSKPLQLLQLSIQDVSIDEMLVIICLQC